VRRAHTSGVPALDDTIAAWASPPARAPRALLRLSGPACPALARALLTPAPSARGAAPARLALPPHVLPVLAAFYPAPRSYTGEDVLELLIPGNPRLVERVLDHLCTHPGVRRAGPGEFTARAYLHGKLTLDQAEGVAASIAALTREELDAARALRDGRAGDDARAWRDELAGVLALVEAAIDFTDQEDVRPISAEALRTRVAAVRDALGTRLGADAGEHIHPGDPLVVLAGAPNAGKSTLFNALLARTRAVAGPAPGTTRDVLVEPLDLARLAPGAGRILLADLAGLDADARGVDALAQQAARDALAAADLVLWCDPSGRFDPAATPPTDAPILRVRTFADQRPAEPSLPSGAGPFQAPASSPSLPSGAGPFQAPSSTPSLSVSALDQRGLPALALAISRALSGVRAAPLLALLPRHRAALRDAAVALDRTLALAHERPDSAEEIAGELRAALDALGELAGRLTPDDVLARVFASFCVGK
jgi:tRNA modification GTPase